MTEKERDKKIVIFSTFFPPHIGGVEYYSKGLAEHFSDKGYDVYIITTTQECIDTNKYNILSMDTMGLINNRLPIIIPNKRNREIIAKLKQLRLDGAIVQTRFYPLSIIAARFLKKADIPFILIEHGTGHFDFSNPLINKVGEWYEHLITWYIKKKCDMFYGVSESCCKWLEHYGIRSKGVLYNSVNIEEFKDKDSNESKETVNISFVGRLIPEKGVEKLIDAFREIRRTKKNIILNIAGTGEIYEKYKNENLEGISFLGGITHSDVVELLRKTDIYCFPSDYPEGLPTTILEAAASRALIVTSEAGGAKEFVGNNEYGVILKENSVD